MTRPFRGPGPFGFSPGAYGGRVPGPLNYGPGASASPTQGGTATSKRRGITVNPASEISGPNWAKMIKASADLPQFIEDQVGWDHDSLTTPKIIKVPSGTREREWLPDYHAAFEGGWEISTCHLEVTAEGDSSSQHVTVGVMPHLSAGEKLGRATPVTDKWSNYKDTVLTFGWTFPTFDALSQTGAFLKSQRGLVVIATRVVLALGGSGQTLKLSDPEMVETLIHEVSVHAGRATEGLSDLHGDKTVERRTREIHDEFAKPGPNSMTSRVYDLLEQFYK
jgi:hypothetical protein